MTEIDDIFSTLNVDYKKREKLKKRILESPYSESIIDELRVLADMIGQRDNEINRATIRACQEKINTLLEIGDLE